MPPLTYKLINSGAILLFNGPVKQAKLEDSVMASKRGAVALPPLVCAPENE